MCCWLRVPKLALSLDVLLCSRKKSSSASGAGSAARRRLMKLLYIVSSVGHIGACVWFYVGANYKVKAPTCVQVFEVELVSISSSDNCRVWYCSFGILQKVLAGIPSPLTLHRVQKSIMRIFLEWAPTHKFGSSTSFHSIGWLPPSLSMGTLLTFHATITFHNEPSSHRSLVGNVTPQNPAEIIICILLMILNLTLFRSYSFWHSASVLHESVLHNRIDLEQS